MQLRMPIIIFKILIDCFSLTDSPDFENIMPISAIAFHASGIDGTCLNQQKRCHSPITA